MVPVEGSSPAATATAYAVRMPAPLGNTKTKKMPDIQVFGPSDSQPTRAALRFFRERRVVVHHVDLKKRPIAPGELQRFVQRLGARALLDVDGRAYADLGLAHMRLDDADVVARLLSDPRLIRLPLVRHGNDVTAGPADATWAAWLKSAGAAAR
jgi:arsenate reductase